MTSQKITKITVTDFMGIEGTIEMFPTGHLQVIAGPNGSGKSSFMHAVEECFDPAGTRLIPNPVNNKAARAKVEILLTDGRIVRDYPKDGPGTLTAYALDGAKYPSGKEFVADITGGVLFDPVDFVKLSDKEQRQTLLSKVTLPFDLAEIDAKRKGFFDGRTDKTREVKRLAAQLAGCAQADASVPDAEVSAASLHAEINAIYEHNTEVNRRNNAAEAAVLARVAADQRGKALAAEMDEHRAQRGALLAAERAAIGVATSIAPQSPDAVAAQLASIDETNVKVRAQLTRAALANELADRTAEEAALTASITDIDKVKADGLAAADFPAGLSVSDDAIMFGDVTFKQLNTARQDSIAFDLATSGNPDLKIVVMKSGNDLDDMSLAAVQKLADERGYFVLMERYRGDVDGVGFRIQTLAVSA
jgi:energy-coupling factor transporter ATP-binding protein EcfA2